MKNKKVLSTVVASALVATTMAMPVMAADGGEVDVDVSTRTAVIRVKVPTSLEVAVNQFEKGDTGSQIFSDTFDIVNKSEIPVKLSVSSTATLASTDPISLVSTKNAAETSKTEEAWLAVAAQTSDGNYIEGADKGIKDLTDANKNVTTFVQGKEAAANTGTAEQVFYLGANTNPSVTYAKLAPTDADTLAAAKETSYAQIYEVEAITFGDASDTTASQTELDAAITSGDVYVEAADSTITFIEKGTTGTVYAQANKYYSVTGQVLRKDLAVNKVYVYGEAADGDKTGFRYLGKLSEGKETWTEDDIQAIKIKYDINGVTATNFEEASKLCSYGLYPSGPRKVAGTKVTNPSGSTTLTGTTFADRLKGSSPTAIFQLDTSATDLTGLSVSKIVIDDTEYNFTAADSTYDAMKAVTDGKIYTISGFNGSSVSKVQLYYGEDTVVEYQF